MTEAGASARNRAVADTYQELVDAGTYSERFQHTAEQTAFFARVMAPHLARVPPGGAVLEAGCGTGVWLAAVHDLLGARADDVSLLGFDLTPGMVEAARRRLAGLGISARLEVGDVLEPSSYAIADRSELDLVYAFDVVQQVPRDAQRRALDSLLSHVRPGGTLVVFDHDARSAYGAVMSAKKRLTRLGVPLVPRFYLTARYPTLGKLARELSDDRTLEVALDKAPDRRKRALSVVRGQ